MKAGVIISGLLLKVAHELYCQAVVSPLARSDRVDVGYILALGNLAVLYTTF